MPQPYRGAHIKVTTRLTPEQFALVAEQAAKRRWSYSEYFRFAVEQQVNRDMMGASARRGPVEPPVPLVGARATDG